MKKLELNKIYQGDSLEVLKTFPDESIDMCVTSPPYWGLRDYDVDGQIGLEETPEEFVNKLCDVFDEVRRVLKPGGSCWVNLGDSYCRTPNEQVGMSGIKAKYQYNIQHKKNYSDIYKPKSLIQIPSRFAIEMTNRGWILRNELIWHKPACMPASVKDRYTVDFEKMFFFTKNRKYHFKQQFEPISPLTLKDKRPPVSVKYVRGKDGMEKKTKVPYAVQPRTKEFVNYRDIPDLHTEGHEEIRQYLQKWRNKAGFTINQVEEHFGNSKGHHWFEAAKSNTSSYPNDEDWKELKTLFGFDDKYDEIMTTVYNKSSEKTSDSRGRNKRTVWSVNPASFKDAHFAVYPPELIESPIDAGCPDDGVVLDPFMGSGTTAEVAMKQGKDWVGIDLNPSFIKIADKRLKPTIIEKKTKDKASECWD